MFQVEEKSGNRMGAGAAIFMRDSLLYKIQNDDAKFLSIKIVSNHSKNIILNAVYRAPDGYYE